MSNKNRRQREAARQARELAAQRPAAAVQASAPTPEKLPLNCSGLDWCELHAVDHGHPEPAPIEPAKPPRKFGKPKTFNLDCGITVTVKGDDETLENEFWPVWDGNELHLYSGDAAIERRIAKQQGTAMQSGSQRIFVAPAGPPQISEEAMNVAGPGGYNGIGPRPQIDAQDEALKSVGIDFTQMAASVPGVARLAAVPDEVVAP